jgi:hypothetical protein
VNGMIMAGVDMTMKEKIWTTRLVLWNVDIAITEVSAWLIVFAFTSYNFFLHQVDVLLSMLVLIDMPSSRRAGGSLKH